MADTASSIQTPPSPARRAAQVLLDLSLPLVLGLWLRGRGLGAESVWMDDFFSASHLNAPTLLQCLRDQRAENWEMVPFYYALQYLWAGLSPGSMVWVRWLSVLFGTAAVAALYGLGRRLFGRWAGFTAALLLAASPFQVFHARGLRPYAMVLLLAILSWWLLVAWQERRGKAALAGHGLLNLALLWSHLFTPLLFLGQGCWLLVVERRNPKRLLAWGMVQLALLATLLPWVAAIHPAPDPVVPAPRFGNPLEPVLRGDMESRDNQFVSLLFMQEAEYLRWAVGFPPKYNEAAVDPKTELLLGFRQPVELAAARLALIGFAGALLCCAGALWAHWKRRRPCRPDLPPRDAPLRAQRIAAVLCWFVLPALGLYAAAVLWKPHAFQARYVLYIWPALYLCCGIAAARFRAPAMRLLMPLAMGGALVFLSVLSTLLPMRPDYLGAGRLICPDKNGCVIVAVQDWNLWRLLGFNTPELQSSLQRYLSVDGVMEHMPEALKTSRAAWAAFEGQQSAEQRGQFERRMKDLNIACARTVLPGMQNLYLYRCTKP
jgi:hypothetical protein